MIQFVVFYPKHRADTALAYSIIERCITQMPTSDSFLVTPLPAPNDDTLEHYVMNSVAAYDGAAHVVFLDMFPHEDSLNLIKRHVDGITVFTTDVAIKDSYSDLKWIKSPLAAFFSGVEVDVTSIADGINVGVSADMGAPRIAVIIACMMVSRYGHAIDENPSDIIYEYFGRVAELFFDDTVIEAEAVARFNDKSEQFLEWEATAGYDALKWGMILGDLGPISTPPLKKPINTLLH